MVTKPRWLHFGLGYEPGWLICSIGTWWCCVACENFTASVAYRVFRWQLDWSPQLTVPVCFYFLLLLFIITSVFNNCWAQTFSAVEPPLLACLAVLVVRARGYSTHRLSSTHTMLKSQLHARPGRYNWKTSRYYNLIILMYLLCFSVQQFLLFYLYFWFVK